MSGVVQILPAGQGTEKVIQVVLVGGVSAADDPDRDPQAQIGFERGFADTAIEPGSPLWLTVFFRFFSRHQTLLHHPVIGQTQS